MMTQCDFPQAGVVLAAGASSRMGVPKALLDCSGRPLAQLQLERLQAAGCDPVRLVLGSEADRIAQEVHGFEVVVNAQWRNGRVGSVQTGLQSVHPFSGCVLLPVDCAGVQVATLQELIRLGQTRQLLSVRPWHDGQRGHCCWISGQLYAECMALDHAAEQRARLDGLLRPIETRVDVADAAVLNNANTPEAWRAVYPSFCELL